MKRFFSHVLRAENFQTMIENSATRVPIFLFFVRTDYFGAFFLRELGFFSDCKPELWSFGWKVFNSRFESAFKLCRKSFHLFFSWKRYYFPRILDNFFLQFEFNNIDSDLKSSEYLCKGTFGKIFPNETTFESCTSSRKLSNFDWKVFDKSPSFSIFVRRRFFGDVFPQKVMIVLDCEPKYSRFGRIVFNSAFEGAIKTWKTASWFFLDSSTFLCGTWAFLCQFLGKKTPVLFSKQLNRCAEGEFGIFSQRKSFLIFFFGRKSFSLWEKLSKKQLSFSFFLCAEDIWVPFSFFLRELGFFRTVSLKNWAWTEKFSTVFSAVHSRWGRQPTRFFVIPQSFFGTWACFGEDWLKKTRHFSKHSKTGVQNKNSVFFFPKKSFFFNSVKLA